MKPSLIGVIVFCLSQHSAYSRAGPSIEGKWKACFTVSYYDVPACGTLDVRKGRVRDSHPAGVFGLHYVTHTVPFGDLGSSLTDFPRYGIMFPTGDSLQWHLQLGFSDSTKTYPSTDDGSIMALLTMVGDSLVGTWDRSSWWPSHKGSVVLRR